MNGRAIISIADGAVGLDLWLASANQEPVSRAKPTMCPGCPLRPGGEWAAGLDAAVAGGVTPNQKRVLSRWNCHAKKQPCAGMRRAIGGEQ